MIIANPQFTARDAAKYFAENYGEEPRKVGLVNNLPNDQFGLTFQFVDGNRWYNVLPLPNYAGWEVKCQESVNGWDNHCQ